MNFTEPLITLAILPVATQLSSETNWQGGLLAEYTQQQELRSYEWRSPTLSLASLPYEMDESPISASTEFAEPLSFTTLEKRIQQLKRIQHAEILEDNKFQPPSEASLLALRSYLVETNVKNKPMLTIRSDGNFRALWKDAQNRQVGITFLGGEIVDYVLFAVEGEEVFPSYGQTNFDSLTSMIYALRLSDLFFDG